MFIFSNVPSRSACVQSAIRNPNSAIRCAALLVIAVVCSTGAAAEPLTLNEAIRLALEKNQALRVSAFSPEIARASVLAEYGRFDPELTFSRSYGEDETLTTTNPLVTQVTKTDDYAVTFGGLTPWGATYGLTATANNRRGATTGFSDNFVTFGGVTITQPLLRGFGFGANLSALRIAKADRRISDWQYRQDVIDTATAVIIVYNNLLQARENLYINQLSRDLTAKLVEQNEKKNLIGQISDADVIQARARLAGKEEQILQAGRAARDLENTLRQLIGETTFSVDPSPLEVEALPPPAPVSVDVAIDLKKAYELRPDYQAARAGIDRRRASHALARNRLLPAVDFVGSYGYSGTDPDFARSRRQVRDEDVRSYTAGVVVSIPLTFTEERGRARAARLSLRQSEADLVRLEQDIAVAIAAAAGQVETTQKRVTANRTAVELTQQSLRAEELKLQAGTSTTFLVLSAQEQLASVQRDLARALADNRKALANYERELGRTLEWLNITLDK